MEKTSLAELWQPNQDGAKPYSIATPPRVPIPLLLKVKEELKRMEPMGIIKKVTDPIEWCAPVVPVVKKNGIIRNLCGLEKTYQPWKI